MADKKDEDKKEAKGGKAPGDKHAPKPKEAKAEGKESKRPPAGPKVESGEQVKPAKVRLKDKYNAEVIPALMEKFQLKNKYAVPKLLKVCLNMGFGKAATDNNPKVGETCVADMTTIAGQKAVVTISRKSVSNFKLRENMQIGCRVTLRGAKMYEFLDRLFNVALPRVRDFRGITPRAFDGRGNYSLGLQEQSVFPEVESDKIDVIHGMDITICTNARKDEQARELLKALGCPFRDH